MKVSLWKVARGYLPTGYRLQTQSIQCNDHCVMQDRLYKNDWHVYFGCDKLEVVWEVARLCHIIKENLVVANGFATLFFQLFEQLPHQQLLIFVMTLWCIWKRRNEKFWSDINTNPRMLVYMAHESLMKWQQAHEHAYNKEEW